MSDARGATGHDAVKPHAGVGGLFDLAPVMRLLADHKAPTAIRSAVVDELALTIPLDVFSPLLTKTSRFFASFIKPKAGDDVLDIFTGTGYLGLLAARRCCRVVCVDHSPTAVACARHNAVRNGVAEIVEVRCGDVFDAVEKRERFDLIIANPPLLPGNPNSILETAVFDPDFVATIRYFDGLSSHLAPGGRGLVLLSDVFERCGYRVDTVCADRGLAAAPLGSFDAGYEVYTVFAVESATAVST